MRVAKLVLVFLLITIRFAHAQDQIKKYVANNTIPISSIDPTVTDFSDLVRLGEAIGNARIVMMGEQDHGDAASFLAKTRLIKYLHEQKGFNVLAFESDFFGLNYGWEKLNKNSPFIDSFLRKNIFPIWTACYGCAELFYHYIPATYQTATPLMISGFDNQLVLQFSVKKLASSIDSLLLALDLPITKQPDYRSAVLPMIDTLPRFLLSNIIDTVFYRKLYMCMAEISKQVNSKLTPDNFWSRLAENMTAVVYGIVTFNRIDQNAFEKIRDAEMAKNLAWLADTRYPTEKIIVWAHNQHIMKQPYTDRFDTSIQRQRMGYFFTSDTLKLKQTYIIGFDSYQGFWGSVRAAKPSMIAKPYKEDFENWIDSSLPYAFIDFKGYNQKYRKKTEPFYMKGQWHLASRSEWNGLFDGVFFIRDMFPCVQ